VPMSVRFRVGNCWAWLQHVAPWCPEVISRSVTVTTAKLKFTVFVDDSYATSDHAAVPSLKRYDWSSANFQLIVQHLATVNWYDLITVNLTADLSWSALSSLMQAPVDQLVNSRSCVAV
jgi:hypothetical protein